MSMLERVKRAACRKTHEMRRAEAMGFTFGPVSVVFVDARREFRIEGEFTCVCGSTESFTLCIDPTEAPFDDIEIHCDIGLQLRMNGSFSRRHLRADGYTEQEIADIIARADAFDERETL